MQIDDIKKLVKERIKLTEEGKKKIILMIKFSLVGASFFGLGILYDQNQLISQKTLKIGQNEALKASLIDLNTKIESSNQASQKKTPETKTADNNIFGFFASKNGTVYYKTSCKSSVKDANKIYFKTEEEAQRAGYRQSKTCFK